MPWTLDPYSSSSCFSWWEEFDSMIPPKLPVIKKQVIPQGWRLLKAGECVQNGDQFKLLSEASWNLITNVSSEVGWNLITNASFLYNKIPEESKYLYITKRKEDLNIVQFGADLVGKVCSDEKGNLGVVTGLLKDSEGRDAWQGISFDGKPWASVDPCIKADTLKEYCDSLLELEDGSCHDWKLLQ